MKSTVTFLAALALTASFTFAADEAKKEKPEGGRRNPEEIFKRLDTNNDGSISLDEFKAGPMAKRDPAKAEELFKKRDKDGDGKLTLEEFKAGRPGKAEEGKPAEAKPAEAK